MERLSSPPRKQHEQRHPPECELDAEVNRPPVREQRRRVGLLLVRSTSIASQPRDEPLQRGRSKVPHDDDGFGSKGHQRYENQPKPPAVAPHELVSPGEGIQRARGEDALSLDIKALAYRIDALDQLPRALAWSDS